MNEYRKKKKKRGINGAAVLALLLVLTFGILLGIGGTLLVTHLLDSDSREQTDKSTLSASVSIKPSTEPSTEPTADSTSEAPTEAAVPSSSTIPETQPEPTLAEQTLASMTLYEKVCQMFIVYPSAVTGVTQTTQAGELTRTGLEKYPVGGFVYNTNNMLSQEQVRTMLDTTQTMTDIPLIFCCDEEGGRVNRLMHTVGTTYIGPMLDYKDQGPEKAYDNACTIARDLVSCGFNSDLAPVADTWSNPVNTVIGDRAYSDDYAEAAILIEAAVQGFHDGGVACTLKHFPGHGDTSEDSHYGSAYVYKDLDTLRNEELLPFQAGIDAGADMVMMGHIILPEVDDCPAVFSKKIVTDLLREEMGFDGVIMTDGLEMQAMIDHYSNAEIAVKAVQAGVDILLGPQDLETAVNALLEAVESGQLTEERIDESVLRILTLKEKYGLLNPLE